MTKTEWTDTIRNACADAGTYEPFFDSVIDTLAGIMETRDNAREKFEASGGQTIVKHTNKSGATNIVKNPALVVIMDCDSVALTYWTALGLTPKGFKQLGGDAAKKKGNGTLEALLEKMM